MTRYFDEEEWLWIERTYRTDQKMYLFKFIKIKNVCVFFNSPNWTNNFGRTFSCHEAHKFPTMQCSNITLIIIINLLRQLNPCFWLDCTDGLVVVNGEHFVEESKARCVILDVILLCIMCCCLCYCCVWKAKFPLWQLHK